MKVSIIICTRNRAHAVIDSLESAARSILRSGAAGEVVVVDNGSTDDTSARVSAWAASCAVPVRLAPEPRKGLSRARNRGLSAAAGELLIFTDDDCRMDEGFVEAALRHDAADAAAPVMRGGRVELGDPADLPLTIKTDREPGRWSRANGSAKRENLGNCVMGCNMALRKSIADRLGPFDERLGAGADIPAAEDTDYIFRAYIAGMDIEYAPDLVVHHFHGRRDTGEGRKLILNYIVGSGALYAKYLLVHPDLCRQLWWDIKGLAREIRCGKNAFMPEINLSHLDKLRGNLKGAALFAKAALRGA